MDRKMLALWIRLAIVMLALIGIVIYLWVIPQFGKNLAADYPAVAYCYRPWLLFLWGTAVPCYVSLVFGWNITREIADNHSFSENNARYLKWISWMSAVDSAYFFIGNFVLMLLDMNRTSVILFSIFIICIGISISLGASALSHIVYKKSRGEAEIDLPEPMVLFSAEEPAVGEKGKVVSGGDAADQQDG